MIRVFTFIASMPLLATASYSQTYQQDLDPDFLLSYEQTMLAAADPNYKQDTYHTNPRLPQQTQLQDCSLFHMEAWQTQTHSIENKALYHCEQISNAYAINIPLTDSQIALETLMLAYEKTALDFSITSLAWGTPIESLPEGPASDTSMVMASAWVMMKHMQTQTRSDLSLDVVLELLQ
jgi:hypothetical protein